ncbi:MAG: hypothetical protein LBT53_09375 [Puniceicoccales bacterium]|nr:hypothetical protein [Puniceicoccales bacterium]
MTLTPPSVSCRALHPPSARTTSSTPSTPSTLSTPSTTQPLNRQPTNT